MFITELDTNNSMIYHIVSKGFVLEHKTVF